LQLLHHHEMKAKKTSVLRYKSYLDDSFISSLVD
jgi:hypothetical protein